MIARRRAGPRKKRVPAPTQPLDRCLFGCRGFAKRGRGTLGISHIIQWIMWNYQIADRAVMRFDRRFRRASAALRLLWSGRVCVGLQRLQRGKWMILRIGG